MFLNFRSIMQISSWKVLNLFGLSQKNRVQHSRNTMKNENTCTKSRVANSKAYRDHASNTEQWGVGLVRDHGLQDACPQPVGQPLLSTSQIESLNLHYSPSPSFSSPSLLPISLLSLSPRSPPPTHLWSMTVIWFGLWVTNLKSLFPKAGVPRNHKQLI